MKICRIYTFESSHFLPHVMKGHKCGRMHGHSYRLEVEIRGPREPVQGWIMDFAALDVIVGDMLDLKRLDHNTLNEIPGLENPTAENLAQWAYDRLYVYGWPEGVILTRVRVHETERGWAELP